MNGKPPGEPAFPIDGYPGLTLRDYFAGQAMAGMYTADSAESYLAYKVRAQEVRAQEAYEMADAMLQARQS